MKNYRRVARELALNILYQADVCRIPLDEAIATAFESVAATRASKQYAEVLVRGTWECRAASDKVVAAMAPEWPPDRQPSVDRNILRMAMYEIDHVDYVPPIVSVDEGVELAKRYSTEDSGKFVNGVLAAYLRSKGTMEVR